MGPIRFTDAQLDAIIAAARPLAVRDRDAFLQAVAELLQARREIGDGDVHRAVVTGVLLLAPEAIVHLPHAHGRGVRAR
jgi:hypothetical protein